MPEVYFTKPGHRDLKGLAPETRDPVKTKLREAREDPRRHVKPLAGYDLYVIRIGQLRAIVDWDRRDDILYVHAIGHRRNVYDREL